ncbi:hypothetical protein COUCH_26920 [Couchioplanes caeruleus]|uniref:hypothetical protein n=1 Tax=Couchioplanes caeruleus TaxID=56438 RepID=UPI0020BEC1C6|nr:hypothetical protein [Couchioplanes caeruleus]UQU62649.1 hypothetical protein COUCH_26920 [Couchioplanes caeruleus]
MPTPTATWIRLAACAVALQVTMTGCHAESRAEPPARPAAQLGERDVIGRTVTVSGKIIRILTTESFVMATDGSGDLSVLVLSRTARDLAKGQTLTFDGNVQVFSYEAYRGQYELSDRQAYAPFEGEQIIVMAPGSPVRTPSGIPPR